MANKLTPRETIEKTLTSVAKANKLETYRNPPHGSSKSGIGAFQVRKEGKVMVSVRDHDVVVYVSPKVLKSGRPGPKGWEDVAHFNHNTPIDVLKKAFEKGLKSKNRSNGSKPQTVKDIKAQKKALEEKLKKLKEEEKKQAAEKKAKAKPKKKKLTPEQIEERNKAIAAEGVNKAMKLING